MRERRRGERLHIVRYDVIAAVHRGVRLSRSRKRERTARRSAEIDVRVRSRRGDYVDDIFLHRLCEMYLAGGRLRPEQLFRRKHLIDRLEGVDDPLRIEDGDLLAACGIAELDA